MASASLSYKSAVVVVYIVSMEDELSAISMFLLFMFWKIKLRHGL